MNIRIRKSGFLFLLICSMCIVTGCFDKKTPEAYLVKAEQSMKEKKFSHAIITLKTALKLEPRNIRIRSLLGKAYLNVGQSLNAQKEVEKAIELGGDESILIPLLVESLMFHGDYEGVINISHEVSAKTLEKVRIYQVLSYFYTSQLPEYPDVINYLTDSESSKNQNLGKLLESINARNHKIIKQLLHEMDNKEIEPEVLFLLGKLHLQYQNYEKAEYFFKKYQNGRTSDLRINLFLAKSSLGQANYNEASSLADIVLKTIPSQPLANEVKAFSSYKTNEYEKAIFHANKSIQNGLASQVNHLVAGLSNFALNQFEAAYEHFKQIKKSISSTHPVHKVIVITEMKIGKLDEATTSILNMDSSTENYNKVLLSMGEHFLKLGDSKNAKEVLKKTSALNYIAPIDLAKIGLMKMSLGDITGLKDVEKVVQKEPGSIEYRLMLVSGYIYQGQLSKALIAVDKVINKTPNSTIGYNLAGSILVKLNRFKDAKKHFEKALIINPENILSFMFKALEAEKKSDYDVAYAHVEKVLEISPEYLDGILSLYRLSKQTNNVPNAIEKIKSIALRFDANRELSLAYAAILIKENRIEQSSRYLLQLKEQNKVDVSIDLLLGDLYVKQGKWQKAKDLYSSVLKQDPSNGLTFNRLVALLDSMSQYNEALTFIRNLKKNSGNSDYLYIMQGYFLTQTKKYQEAIDVLNLVSSASKELPQFKGISALAEFGLSNENIKINDIKIAYQETPSSYYSLAIAAYYVKYNQKDLAVSFLTKHVTEHERSYSELIVLANLVSDNKPDLAIEYYQQSLKGLPNNFVVLNNLALLSLRKKDLASSIQYIERAVKLAPRRTAVLDSYAQILLASGKAEKSVNIYKAMEAEVKLSADQIMVYAKGLIILKKRDVALDKLKTIVGIKTLEELLKEINNEIKNNK